MYERTYTDTQIHKNTRFRAPYCPSFTVCLAENFVKSTDGLHNNCILLISWHSETAANGIPKQTFLY